METSLLIWSAVFVVLATFFAGVQAMFASIDRAKIQPDNPAHKLVLLITGKPSRLLLTIRVGNIISLVLYGILMAKLFYPLLQTWFRWPLITFVGQILLSSLVILASAELISRTLIEPHANRLLNALIIPFSAFYYLLFPLVSVMLSFSQFIMTYILRMEADGKPKSDLVEIYNGKISQTPASRESDLAVDQKIFLNALEFKSVKVYECMIPRTEITAVEVRSGIDKLREVFVESGHSKILVYRDTIDDVIGYCHSSSLYKKPEKIEDILTPIITVPENMLAKELMVRFINERKSLAVVIDEFGGNSGMVSMEDVIEEIFGEIEDEHDVDDLVEQKLDENSWLLSARLEIDYLNETYGWQLPTGDYETLGGLILSQTEDIPIAGELVQIPPFVLTVQSTLDNRIDMVKVAIQKVAGSDS